MEGRRRSQILPPSRASELYRLCVALKCLLKVIDVFLDAAQFIKSRRYICVQLLHFVVLQCLPKRLDRSVVIFLLFLDNSHVEECLGNALLHVALLLPHFDALLKIHDRRIEALHTGAKVAHLEHIIGHNLNVIRGIIGHKRNVIFVARQSFLEVALAR